VKENLLFLFVTKSTAPGHCPPPTPLSEPWLSDLSILYVENDKLRIIDFDDTVDDFEARKARRNMF